MIYIPSVCGTCKGITKSLGKVYEIYENEMNKENPKRIYLYKPIINNSKVIEEFKNLGIDTINDLSDLTSDDIVILRSYGETKETYDYLNNNNIEYYDTTCSNIIKKEKEILDSNSDICPEIEKENDKSAEYFCNAFNRILKSSEEISKKVQLMFVIGMDREADILCDRLSKNTKVYKINNIVEFYKNILNSNINTTNNIGITGGISVPLKEIYNYKYLLSFILFYKERLNELKSGQDDINNSLIKDDNIILKDSINSFIDLNKGGKYIRGILIALSNFIASNNKSLEYIKLAYAYETFETSILIHDDIIDNAKIRRGKMTIPRRICNKYLNLKNDSVYQNDVLRLANSVGICLGDYGFYEANNIILDNYKNNSNLANILKIYNDIVIKTIKGEILDIILPFKNKYEFIKSKEQDIIDIYENKTSMYTVVGPFMLGYALAGKELENNFKEILNKIGISFQIKDDLLGIYGNDSITGKSNISDILEYKQTILYTRVLETPYKEEFLKLYGKKNLKDSEISRIKELLYISGSYTYALDYLENLSNEILNDLDNLDISDEYKDIIKGLVVFINVREK